MSDPTDSRSALVVQAVIDFLATRFPSDAAALTAESRLFDDGLVDSLGVLELMSFLAEQHGFEMDEEDFLPENFDTINALARHVIARGNPSTP